jgi:hypothetical protein
MDEWTHQIIKELGNNIESAGRMLKRNPAFTKQELTDLRDVLSYGAETLQIIRDTTFQ